MTSSNVKTDLSRFHSASHLYIYTCARCYNLDDNYSTFTETTISVVSFLFIKNVSDFFFPERCGDDEATHWSEKCVLTRICYTSYKDFVILIRELILRKEISKEPGTKKKTLEKILYSF